MCSTLALVAGMAQPAACAAPPARDAPAPHARISCAALCLSAGAWSRFGDVGLVDGRGAGIHAVGIRAGIAADAGSTPTGTRGFAVVGGGRVAALLEIALRTRPMLFYQKKFDTPTGTIRAYLNIFQRFLQR